MTPARLRWIWAAADLAKTKILIDHKADVNAISDGRRTALMVCRRRVFGGLPIVKLLVEHGANVNPTKNTQAESSPLAQAAESARSADHAIPDRSRRGCERVR